MSERAGLPDDALEHIAIEHERDHSDGGALPREGCNGCRMIEYAMRQREAREQAERALVCEHCGLPMTCNASVHEELDGYKRMFDENIAERDAANKAREQAEREREEIKARWLVAESDTWEAIATGAEVRLEAVEGALRKIVECPAHSLHSCMCQHAARAALHPARPEESSTP